MNIVFAVVDVVDVVDVVFFPWHGCSSDIGDIVGHCSQCGDVIVMIMLK